MSAPWLMLCASLLFAVMGVCVKLAAAQYSAGEMVFYRSLVGALFIVGLTRVRGGTLATAMPAAHFWRSVCGAASLVLWFHAIGGLPLATAMTLNYMSAVWMALFLIGGGVLVGAARVDGRLVATVLTGFAGVALVLRPTIEQQQLWHGVSGLISGMRVLVHLRRARVRRRGHGLGRGRHGADRRRRPGGHAVAHAPAERRCAPAHPGELMP